MSSDGEKLDSRERFGHRFLVGENRQSGGERVVLPLLIYLYLFAVAVSALPVGVLTGACVAQKTRRRTGWLAGLSAVLLWLAVGLGAYAAFVTAITAPPPSPDDVRPPVEQVRPNG